MWLHLNYQVFPVKMGFMRDYHGCALHTHSRCFGGPTKIQEKGLKNAKSPTMPQPSFLGKSRFSCLNPQKLFLHSLFKAALLNFKSIQV